MHVLMNRPAILRFRVELLGIEPLVWRRLQMSDRSTFWELHVAIQSAFGWNDSHLHVFRPCDRDGDGSCFGIPMDEFDDLVSTPTLPGWEHRVADVISLARPRYEYEYDFGDGWRHLVTLEDIVPAGPGKKYPRCTAGERAGPPDDCGGPWGYANLLEVLANPDDPDHAASHAWAISQKGGRGAFDPEAFDEQQVRFANPAARLKRLLVHFASRG
jgi:hypothetical protein